MCFLHRHTSFLWFHLIAVPCWRARPSDSFVHPGGLEFLADHFSSTDFIVENQHFELLPVGWTVCIVAIIITEALNNELRFLLNLQQFASHALSRKWVLSLGQNQHRRERVPVCFFFVPGWSYFFLEVSWILSLLHITPTKWAPTSYE